MQQIEKLNSRLYILFKYFVRHKKMQKFLPISAHIQFHLKQNKTKRSFSQDIHVNQCKVKQSNSVEMIYYNIILGGFLKCTKKCLNHENDQPQYLPRHPT